MSTVRQAVFARVRVAGFLAAAGMLVLLGGVVPAQAAPPVHRVTLVMTEFKFEPATIHLKAGERVALTIRNDGTTEHEWSAGRNVVLTQAQAGYRTDLWALLRPTVAGMQYTLEKAKATPGNDLAEGETAEMLSTELDVQPGGSVTLHFTVPASAKGRWGFGCFVPGHYDAGMKGTLVVE
jgi:uncharacterized cupredoxin-like copper-binding protein